MIRQCVKCGCEKDSSEFYRVKWGIGIDCWCIECRKQYNRFYLKNKKVRGKGQRIEYTPEMIAEMVYKRIQLGRSYLSIGRDLGISYFAVRRFMMLYEQKIKELDDKNIAKNFHKS